jgi:tetratricopeptide (TPR) repeat protein
MSQTIFLSTTTTEFGPLRRRLASICTRIKRVHVRHQDEFIHRGTLTLHTLEDEIRRSDLVIHVIGADFGSAPPVDQVEDLLLRLPDFESRFPEVFERARRTEISYTQWEFWLGMYLWGPTKVCRYEVAETRDRRDPRQAAHLELLKKLEIFPQPVPVGAEPFDEVVATLIDRGYLTEQESRPIISLPYPPLGTLFKGRDAFLEKLKRSLEHAATGGATAITGKAVHGLGGVGKTRLAVEYAWRHADDFTAVLFVTADSPAALRQNLAELAGPLVLNLPEQQATEEPARVAAALRWLHDHPGWFLILDNVDTNEAAEAAEDFLAKLHGGQVLITARLAKFSSSVEPLELDVLETADAASFLLERTQPQDNGRGRQIQSDDAAIATSLALELDGLALALEQAGAYICQNRLPLAEYLRRWRSHDQKVQTWYDRQTMKYPRSVAVTWQTTLDQLPPAEIVLFNILAWFAPDPIPLDVIAHFDFSTIPSLIACVGPPSAASDPGSPPAGNDQDADENPRDIRGLLANLADYGMLAWDVAADNVTVHRVVQEIVRTRQHGPIPVLTAALRILDAASPEGNAGDVRTWPQWDLLRPHVAFAVEEADRRDITEPTTDLMGGLGTFLSAKALHQEAELFNRRALAIDERRFGPNSTSVALRLNNLAQTLDATNRLAESEPLMRRALAIDEQSYGPDHPDVATDLNNLAQLLQATNRFAEAEPLMRAALATDEKSYGPNHPDVARDLNNLALLLVATNRLAEAEPLYRRALAIDQRSYGLDHPDVATDLNNLAQLLQATNRVAESEPLIRRALAIDEQSYGPEHPNVAIRLNNLAMLLQDTNRLAEAEPLMRRALAISADFKRRTGHEHPNFRGRMANYRAILDELGIPPDDIDRRVQEACGD